MDCDTTDDSSAPTAPEAAAAQAEQEARAAAESVRAATLQRLQDLKRRLEQVCRGRWHVRLGVAYVGLLSSLDCGALFFLQWFSGSNSWQGCWDVGDVGMQSYPWCCTSALPCATAGLSMQVLEANTAAPADQQLSEAEVVLNSQLLQQLRGEVAAEEGELLSEAPRRSLQQEVQAKRLKALCWDAFQVRSHRNFWVEGAGCGGGGVWLICGGGVWFINMQPGWPYQHNQG